MIHCRPKWIQFLAKNDTFSNQKFIHLRVENLFISGTKIYTFSWCTENICVFVVVVAPPPPPPPPPSPSPPLRSQNHCHCRCRPDRLGVGESQCQQRACPVATARIGDDLGISNTGANRRLGRAAVPQSCVLPVHRVQNCVMCEIMTKLKDMCSTAVISRI